MSRVYEEIVDFIAAGSTPDEVAAFQPSPAVKARASELLERNKSQALAPDEQGELNHFLELEHIMRLAKARARHCLP